LSRFSSWIRRRLFIPLWVAREGSPRLRYLRELEASQHEGLQRLQGEQFERLREILSYAYDQCDYYRDQFTKCNVKIDAIQGPDDLRNVPFLSKRQLQEQGSRLIAAGYRGRRLSKFKTGGSTGTPVVVWKDPETVEKGAAAGMRAFKWAGWKPGEPWGLIWGNPPKRVTTKEKLRDLLIDPAIYLDTMALNAASMSEFIAQWARRQPTMMRGHSHSIFTFASYCRKTGHHGIRPRGIISSSMMLLGPERMEIEMAFGCKVTDLYGCEEVGLIACECEHHDGMHLNMENVFVEFIKEDGEYAAPGEPGEIVVTSLINRAMPLIRYRIGDVGVPSDRTCRCGRTLTLMEGVCGRTADFLVRKDGTLVAGVSLIERTLTAYPGIFQMQIVQQDLDTIQIHLVKNQGYAPETERNLVSRIKQDIGDDVTVEIDFVDGIPQTPSGKYRFAISHVPNPFLSKGLDQPVAGSESGSGD